MYKFFKKRFKETLHGLGYEVQSYNIFTSEDVQTQTFLKHFNIKSVLDIGANEGQFAERLIDLGFKGMLYSFEPIGSIYKLLSAKASSSSQWKTFQSGVGKETGELMLNVSENFASSSLLNVNEASTSVDPTTRTTHREKISITTIDEFLGSHPEIQKDILLKLDVQGFELEALKGGVNSLELFKAVQVELSFTPVYQGGPLYLEVISFLQNHNFELFSLSPAFVDKHTGRMLQADGLFINQKVSPGRK